MLMRLLYKMLRGQAVSTLWATHLKCVQHQEQAYTILLPNWSFDAEHKLRAPLPGIV